MDDLTPRQIQILKSIVEEYTQTAEAVGSDVLEKKYSLGVSPATIRNEMAALTAGGYLKQPHTSAGRIPTPKAIKLYVDQLMDEKKLSVTEEVAAKERVLSARDDFDKMMHEATRALAQATHSLAAAALESGDTWHAGYSNILDTPEFYNIDVTSHVLSLLEEAKRLQEVFCQNAHWDEPFEILFGEELGWPHFEPVGMVTSHFTSPYGRGTLGVIGPVRFNYSAIIPTVRYFGDLISEASAKWQEK
ncbi:MAG: hypothetical protein HY377_00090 [Candidatus Blackburnbacteria bacterium]|nr:hypothetical protein [Candidatus Blackburnbacteria bacterium]